MVEIPGTNLTGVVRSYNGSKGFGFITGQGAYSDVMFSRNELPEDAREVRGKFLESRQVTFDAKIGADGRAKATLVQIPLAEGVFLPGQIKSYSEKNGYGFLSSSSLPQDDIRFSKSDFPPLAFGVSLKGALVIFQWLRTADQKLRVSKIQFQTAKIAEKYKDVSPERYMGNPAPMGLPTLGTETLVGTVKSFSERNGYGFLSVPGQVVDIMFGRTDVPGGKISPGITVQFLLALTPNGRVRAKQLTPIQGKGAARLEASEGYAGKSGYGAMLRAIAAIPTGQRLVGMVKSYNATKGFGFISSSSASSDVFFLKSNLPAEAQASNLQGQTVEYELMRTPDNNLRAQLIKLTPTNSS